MLRGRRATDLLFESLDFDFLLHELREFPLERRGPDVRIVDEVILRVWGQLPRLVEDYLVVSDAMPLQPLLGRPPMFIRPCGEETNQMAFIIEPIYLLDRVLEGPSSPHPFRPLLVPDVLTHGPVYVNNEDLPVVCLH